VVVICFLVDELALFSVAAVVALVPFAALLAAVNDEAHDDRL